MLNETKQVVKNIPVYFLQWSVWGSTKCYEDRDCPALYRSSGATSGRSGLRNQVRAIFLRIFGSNGWYSSVQIYLLCDDSEQSTIIQLSITFFEGHVLRVWIRDRHSEMDQMTVDRMNRLDAIIPDVNHSPFGLVHLPVGYLPGHRQIGLSHWHRV